MTSQFAAGKPWFPIICAIAAGAMSSAAALRQNGSGR
jgi:hypothetical protein